MEIIFLGTGTSQGVPMIGCDCAVCKSADYHDKRLRSSILVKTGSFDFIIDTGPDFRTQMIRENISRLDAVLITHPHRDHLSGLDDIRAFNYSTKSSMPVYGNQNTLNHILREFDYAFRLPKYPGVPDMDLKLIDDTPFILGDTKIIPINVWHYKMPVTAFRIGDLAYITDASSIDEDQKVKLFGVKTLVVNALRKEPHISHFSLSQAIDLSRQVGAKETFITHIGHRMGCYQDLAKELPSGIFQAYDGLKLSV